MSDQNYPARGCVSEDGKVYTHTDGTVHVRSEANADVNSCSYCSVEWLEHNGFPCTNCESCMRIIEGAYVPSDDERAVCEMARAAIVMCSVRDDSECDGCYEFHNKLCHLRKYLAAHGDDQAWEVK